MKAPVSHMYFHLWKGCSSVKIYIGVWGGSGKRLPEVLRPVRKGGSYKWPSETSQEWGLCKRPSKTSQEPGSCKRPSKTSQELGSWKQPSKTSQEPGLCKWPSKTSQEPGSCKRPSKTSQEKWKADDFENKDSWHLGTTVISLQPYPSIM